MNGQTGGRRTGGKWTGNQGAVTRGRWRAVPVGQSLWQVQEWSDDWCVWRDRGRPVFRLELPTWLRDEKKRAS